MIKNRVPGVPEEAAMSFPRVSILTRTYGVVSMKTTPVDKKKTCDMD